MRASLYLCHARGRFLYEARPDLFPQGFLTAVEAQLWDRFYRELKRKRK